LAPEAGGRHGYDTAQEDGAQEQAADDASTQCVADHVVAVPPPLGLGRQGTQYGEGLRRRPPDAFDHSGLLSVS